MMHVLVLAVANSVRQNVLFLAADDMRIALGVDRVPGTHTMSTPNLDAIISKSLFLRKAHVQQAVCSPTRTSLLTSRYPDTTRVWDLYSYWRDVGGNFTTIPQLFKDHGYLTIGIGKIFHPGHASGAGPGPDGNKAAGDDGLFSWSTPSYHAPSSDYWSSAGPCRGCGNSWIAVSPAEERAVALPDTQLAQHAVETLSNFSRDGIGKRLDAFGARPFFLAVGFHKPHLPFVSPERFYQSYPLDEVELPANEQPPKDMPRVAWSSWGELRKYKDIASLHSSGLPGQTLPQAVTRDLRRAYYAAVSFTDHNLGLVLAALEVHGYANNTIISFWGDHGWQLGEHGEWCKHTNFDLATNAPMFVRIPGRTDSGVSTSTPTEFVDLMPTLAEAAMGLTVPACPAGAAGAAASRNITLCTHGVSLLPLIAEPTAAVKPAAYSQYPRSYIKPMVEGENMVEEEEEGADMVDLDLFASDGFGDVGPEEPGSPGASPCLSRRCTMGYSMLTVRNGTEYRYTEWVDFNTKVSGGPDWDRVVGTELYDHAADPLENVNIVKTASSRWLGEMSALLHQHPVWAEKR